MLYKYMQVRFCINTDFVQIHDSTNEEKISRTTEKSWKKKEEGAKVGMPLRFLKERGPFRR